jgi:hypothetical protein
MFACAEQLSTPVFGAQAAALVLFVLLVAVPAVRNYS